ncbi:GntR family transcriptional regulator [Sinimarinibacterium sp. CAU 1509]|uniref:PaaX family transcriptional regulator C-terminal domain-containing protein n=1 Tax=Sinimarinibacterium sp. CAU 1509 TaxID=2562283 RepID=UPI0010AB7D17|nr:PaaX family transcriptional regulator C-terminal domain-containing protein [Sinimarinibacterium sp. CAU 1509]TJY64991.1 GntR family transcriptional regulator [Sinimarinibacterium sp. CAU 1509]
MKPRARNLILDLLLANEGHALNVRDLIGACALFEVSANTVRVALVRLSAEGLIEAVERGSYQLSGTAHQLADDVATWRHAEQRIRPWSGAYLAVHCGALGRSDRSALRRRHRALQMLGFRELERDLFVRPDNIDDSVTTVRKRLHALGLDTDACVFVATGFDAAREARIPTLWDGSALSDHYRRQRERLEAWMQRAPSLEPDVAAREAFLIGGQAIRDVVFDPLLPEPMVDTAARHAFVESVRRFDRYGHAIWQSAREYSAQMNTPKSSRLSTH